MKRDAVHCTALLVTDSNVFFRHLARRIENLFENVHIAKNIQEAERKLEEFSFSHVVGIIPFGYYDKPIIDFVKNSKQTAPSLYKTAILAFEDLPNSAGVDTVLSLDDNLTSIIEALRAAFTTGTGIGLMSRKEHPPVTPGAEYYTDVEAAELLGMEVEDVRKWVDHQILVGAVVRGRYEIQKFQVDERVKELKAKGLLNDD